MDSGGEGAGRDSEHKETLARACLPSTGHAAPLCYPLWDSQGRTVVLPMLTSTQVFAGGRGAVIISIFSLWWVFLGFFLVTSHYLQDLSSLTRDGTWAPAGGKPWPAPSPYLALVDHKHLDL